MKAAQLMWLQFHKQWLEKLPNPSHIVTKRSGHGVPFEEPDLIVHAIGRWCRIIRPALEARERRVLRPHRVG